MLVVDPARSSCCYLYPYLSQNPWKTHGHTPPVQFTIESTSFYFYCGEVDVRNTSKVPPQVGVGEIDPHFSKFGYFSQRSVAVHAVWTGPVQDRTTFIAETGTGPDRTRPDRGNTRHERVFRLPILPYLGTKTIHNTSNKGTS
jgi:hypothetical protein